MEENKLLIIPKSLPEYQDSNVRVLMHFCYLHGTLDEAFGNDAFGVDMRSVTYECYENNNILHYISKKDVANMVKGLDYDQLRWFEVEVKGYNKPCMAIVQDYIFQWGIDEKSLQCFPRVQHNGVIVDAEEWALGLDYVCRKSYKGRKEYSYEDCKRACECYSLMIRGKMEEALELI